MGRKRTWNDTLSEHDRKVAHLCTEGEEGQLHQEHNDRQEPASNRNAKDTSTDEPHWIPSNDSKQTRKHQGEQVSWELKEKCDVGTTHSSQEAKQETRFEDVDKSNEEEGLQLSQDDQKLLYEMGCRPFINTPFGDAVMQTSFKDQDLLSFRVASYNVLSQDLISANPYLYKSVNPSLLEWDYRKCRLMRDIYYTDAAVVCLQEVHQEHYETFFRPQLEARGYQGYYIKRTGSQSDGCASFVKKSVFQVEKVTPVAYYRKGISVLDRHNVALVLLLSVKQDPQVKLCVSNTHLLFNPRRDDVRFAQMMILLAEIDRMACYDTAESGRPLHYPVIMCGDFNSEPCSDLYHLIRRGRLKYYCLIAGSRNDRLLHPSVGITDQCQYIADVYWRFVRYANIRRNSQKQETSCEQNTSHSPARECQSLTQNTDKAVASLARQDSTVIQDVLPVFMNSTSMTSSEMSLPSTSEINEATLVRNPVFNLSKFNLPESFHFTFGSGYIQHCLPFDSVYTHASGNDQEVTTSHSRANCTVDYLFYTRQRKNECKSSLEPCELRLLNRLKLLTQHQVLKLGGLPNRVMSSDHFIICGTFVLGLHTGK